MRLHILLFHYMILVKNAVLRYFLTYQYFSIHLIQALVNHSRGMIHGQKVMELEEKRKQERANKVLEGRYCLCITCLKIILVDTKPLEVIHVYILIDVFKMSEVEVKHASY